MIWEGPERWVPDRPLGPRATSATLIRGRNRSARLQAPLPPEVDASLAWVGFAKTDDIRGFRAEHLARLFDLVTAAEPKQVAFPGSTPSDRGRSASFQVGGSPPVSMSYGTWGRPMGRPVCLPFPHIRGFFSGWGPFPRPTKTLMRRLFLLFGNAPRSAFANGVGRPDTVTPQPSGRRQWRRWNPAG